MRMEKENAKNQTLKQGREWRQASRSIAKKMLASAWQRAQTTRLHVQQGQLVNQSGTVGGQPAQAKHRLRDWVAVNRLRHGAHHHGQVQLADFPLSRKLALAPG